MPSTSQTRKRASMLAWPSSCRARRNATSASTSRRTSTRCCCAAKRTVSPIRRTASSPALTRCWVPTATTSASWGSQNARHWSTSFPTRPRPASSTMRRTSSTTARQRRSPRNSRSSSLRAIRLLAVRRTRASSCFRWSSLTTTARHWRNASSSTPTSGSSRRASRPGSTVPASS